MAAHRTAEHSAVHLRFPGLIAVFRATRLDLSMEWGERRDSPLFGLVAVPLAMTATGLLDQWWTWQRQHYQAEAPTNCCTCRKSRHCQASIFEVAPRRPRAEFT